MTNSRIRPWRRFAEAAQAVLLLGIPFVRIGGESALRFDIPTLRLHVFGTSLWMDEFFIVLIAVFFFTFLVILVTQLFGRIWCGWLCPQTVIIDLTWFLDRAKSKTFAQRAVAYSLTLLVSIIVAADLIWYFISPYDFLPALMNGTLGTVTWGFWLSLSAIIFLNYAFLRHTWCATVCPYAKLQGALFDNRTMIIGFDTRRKDECMDCRACVRICPVNVDIRNGLNAACITCTECIDACTERMEKKKRESLISYFFGSPGSSGSLVRTNVIMFASLTLLSLVFFLYLSLSRNPLDLTVLPNNEFRARTTAQGEVINAYTLAVENRGHNDLALFLRALRDGKQLKAAPEKIVIKAGEYKRIPAYVFFPASDKAIQPGMAELTLETEERYNVRIIRNVNLSVPEAP
jgi:cytochrome c oxidase accessory protein FixG